MLDCELPSVTANTLARIIGLPPKDIYDLTKAGIIERGAGRLFDLEDNVARYCDHLRRQAMQAHAPSTITVSRFALIEAMISEVA